MSCRRLQIWSFHLHPLQKRVMGKRFSSQLPVFHETSHSGPCAASVALRKMESFSMGQHTAAAVFTHTSTVARHVFLPGKVFVFVAWSSFNRKGKTIRMARWFVWSVFEHMTHMFHLAILTVAQKQNEMTFWTHVSLLHWFHDSDEKRKCQKWTAGNRGF